MNPVTHESGASHRPKIGETRFQRYCGPGAVSALTGCTAEEAARRYNRIRGARENKLVRGVDHFGTIETIEVLESLGYRALLLRFEPLPMRLGNWIAKRSKPGVKYLVHVTGHYCVVRDGLVVDNQVEIPVKPEEFRYRNSKVEGVYAVTLAEPQV